ncbi:MAG: ABC transporter ATP-binding protein [Deltaproteobacteria bacterium]|nr:ABC transporter ATP-binding protein [Deltaproteobacteria bacterium]
MIRTTHVFKQYADREVIRDLDLHIEQGECVGLLGENGAGKTTTLRMLACLLLPSAGSIRVNGVDAEEHPEQVRAELGYLPDTPPLYDEMSVGEYLRFAGKLRGMDAARLKRRLPEVLDQTGLEDVAEQRISTLSHGYRQRVGIAQAVVHEPAILILDEPINGLDPVQIVEMREMIRRLRGAHTILLSTHILTEIEQTCDRILMLHDGRIAAEGTEQELSSRLGGRGFVRVEVRGGDEARAKALALAEGLGFSAHGAHAQTGALDLEGDAAGHPALARALIEAGLELARLEPRSSDLEEIFLQVSRGDPPVEAPESATDAKEVSS